MPNTPPGLPIGQGVTSTPDKYPQWGTGGGTPGSSAGWQIVEARNASQKQQYVDKGYAPWFTSKAAAQSFLSSEESPYQSGEPQNAIPGLSQIGDFFGRLGEASTWVRVAEVVLGVVLIAVGTSKLLHLKAPNVVPLPV